MTTGRSPFASRRTASDPNRHDGAGSEGSNGGAVGGRSGSEGGVNGGDNGGEGSQAMSDGTAGGLFDTNEEAGVEVRPRKRKAVEPFSPSKGWGSYERGRVDARHDRTGRECITCVAPDPAVHQL